MSNRVRIRIRCAKGVREKWEEARGAFDLTHGEFALNCATFVLSHSDEFKRHLSGESRTDETGQER